MFITVPINAQSLNDSDAADQNEQAKVVLGGTLRVGIEWVERDFYIVDGVIKWTKNNEPTDMLYVQNKLIAPGSSIHIVMSI